MTYCLIRHGNVLLSGLFNDVRCPICILDAPSLWKHPHESPSSAAKKENLAFSICIQERPIHHGKFGLIYHLNPYNCRG